VVANNAGWIAIRDLQAAVYGEPRAIGAEFLKEGAPISPSLAALAQAFGCHAERISEPDEVRPALERAFAAGTPRNSIQRLTQPQILCSQGAQSRDRDTRL